MDFSADPTTLTRFLGEDCTILCRHCNIEAVVTESMLHLQRGWCDTERICLHALDYKSFRINVTDVLCPISSNVVQYDGLDDAIFCVTKHHALTRELLDAWMCDTCGNGGTFRDNILPG